MMKANSEAFNTIAWLLGYLQETVNDFDGNDKSDMEERLMKAEALLYAISAVEDRL